MVSPPLRRDALEPAIQRMADSANGNLNEGAVKSCFGNLYVVERMASQVGLESSVKRIFNDMQVSG